MLETKTAFWKRLEGTEGWNVASEWMKKRRHELLGRFPSVTPGVVKAHVWAEATQRFPKNGAGLDPTPLPEKAPKPEPEKPKDPDEEFRLSEEELEALLAGESGNLEAFRADLAWAYQHVPDYRLTAENCPSSGAFGVLVWARKFRDKFYALYARVMQDAAKDGTDELLGDDGRRQLALAERLAGEVP